MQFGRSGRFESWLCFYLFLFFQFNGRFVLSAVKIKSLNAFTIEVDFKLAAKCLIKSVRNWPIEHEKKEFFSGLELKFWLSGLIQVASNLQGSEDLIQKQASVFPMWF